MVSLVYGAVPVWELGQNVRRQEKRARMQRTPRAIHYVALLPVTPESVPAASGRQTVKICGRQPRQAIQEHRPVPPDGRKTREYTLQNVNVYACRYVTARSWRGIGENHPPVTRRQVSVRAIPAARPGTGRRVFQTSPRNAYLVALQRVVECYSNAFIAETEQSLRRNSVCPGGHERSRRGE